jgi:hypothetical protein
MTAMPDTPQTSAPAASLESVEFVTLAGHQYVCVHLEEDGWKREHGYLDPTFPRWTPRRLHGATELTT